MLIGRVQNDELRALNSIGKSLQASIKTLSLLIRLEKYQIRNSWKKRFGDSQRRAIGRSSCREKVRRQLFMVC